MLRSVRSQIFFKTVPLLNTGTINSVSSEQLKKMNNEIKGYFAVGNLYKVNQVFKEINNPDIFTYSIMLKGLSRFKDINRINRLFEESKKKLKPDVILYSTYIQILAEYENFVKIKEVLLEMSAKGIQPNFVCFGFIFAGLAKTNKLKDSLYIVAYMKRNGFELNEYHVSNVLKIYAQKTKYPMKDIFNFLEESKVKPNLIIHNVIISAYMNRNLVQDGWKYFQSLLEVDEVSYNTLIAGFCKVNQIESALELFDELKSFNLKIDQNSIVPIITCFKRLKMPEAVNSFIRSQAESASNGIVLNAIIDTLVELDPENFISHVENAILQPKLYDAVTIASISKMYLKVGKMNEFDELMKKYNITLTIDYYNTLISHYKGIKEYEKVVETFENLTVAPDIVTFHIMLSYYLDRRNMEKVMDIWWRIENPKQRSYYILISGLFRIGKIDLAHDLYQSMDIIPSAELKDLMKKKKQIKRKRRIGQENK